MSKKANDTLRGVGTGAALGGTLGSVVPGIGTAIGTGIGAIGGGLVGFFGSKDEQPEENQQAQDDAMAQADKAEHRDRLEAYQRFMLGEAARNGANPTLLARKQLDISNQGIDDHYGDVRDQIGQQAAAAGAQDDFDPSLLLPLANATGRAANGLYNYYSAPEVAKRDAFDKGTQEATDEENPESIMPIRKGVRQGWNG